MFGVQTKPLDGSTRKELDNGCKKQALVIGKEVWLDHSHPRFLPKELRSSESIPLTVIRSLPGGVLDLYYSVKGRFRVDGQWVKDARPMLNP